MAFKIVKKETSFDYIPVDQRKEENPLTFVFRPLSKKESALLSDGVLKLDTTTQALTVGNSSYLLQAIRLCLTEVKNLVDDKDKPVSLEKDSNGEVTYDFLEYFPDSMLEELGNVIVAVSKDPANADTYLGKE